MTGAVLTTDPISPIESIFNLERTDITALQNAVPVTVADLNALPVATTVGRLAYITSMSCLFRANGASWFQLTTAYFTSTANRDTEYAKAGGVYLTNRATCIITSAPLFTYVYNGSFWRNSTAGLIPIVPSTATGTGVTLSPNGQIACAAVSAPIANGVFSGEFDMVRVVLRGITSASTTIAAQLATGGAPVTSANYDTTVSQANSTANTVATTSAAVSWALATAGSPTVKTVILDISSADIATYTTAIGSSQEANTAGNSALSTLTLFHRLQTAYDGLGFLFTGGTFTGTIRFYGYNNNV
jgi:hypothetical protein